MKQRSSNWSAWILAIRPRTLPAAAAGVLMGSALAWRDGFFRLDAALACLLTALLLQIGSNLANDVFDFERGTDTPERLGPVRVTQAGLLTPSQVKYGMGVVFGLAALFAARAGRRRAELTLRRSGARTAVVGRFLGLFGLLFAGTGTISLVVYAILSGRGRT